MLICKECGEPFDPKHPHHRRGHFSVCGDCEPKHIVDGNRSIAFFDVTGKSQYQLEIIVNPADAEKAMVKRMGRCGPSHCHTSLGLCSNGANTPKDKIDAVHASLYDAPDSDVAAKKER
jgi:hypothetical protein